jgi:nitrite reductase/ring-hydroxylating ferredoxin subunit
MGPVSAQLLDELGYDPDDGLADLADLAGLAGLAGLADLADLAKLADLVDHAELVTLAGRGLATCAVIAARVGARRVAVARLGSGRLVVVDDQCPHDGGRISDGFVEGERLVCARHGWELEARNGRCERACKLRE